MSAITENKVGVFHYTLTNDDGDILDSSEGKEPLAYLHGFGNIVPGLEAQLEGKQIGDKFVAVVLPEEAYGEFDEEGFFEVPKVDLPPDMFFQEGMPLQFEDQDGNVRVAYMDAFEDDVYTFNLNHPLAGQTLTFNIEVVGIRDALAVELEHGHPHGIDGTGGHHHNH